MKTNITVFIGSILLLLCSFSSLVMAQNKMKIGERIIIGNSLTYIWETNDLIPNTYQEFTWNKNIAVNLTNTLYGGISYQNLFTNGSIVSANQVKNRYYLAGVFVQYDFLPAKPNRLIAELSWNVGNYCTCGDGDPYEFVNANNNANETLNNSNVLNYIGVGGSYEIMLHQFLALELGFYNYNILGDVKEKYNYTQYIIGLNFDIGKW